MFLNRICRSVSRKGQKVKWRKKMRGKDMEG